MKERLILDDQSDEQSNLTSKLATKEKLIEEQRKEIEVHMQCTEYSLYVHIPLYSYTAM